MKKPVLEPSVRFLAICRDSRHFESCYLEKYGIPPMKSSDGTYYRYIENMHQFHSYTLMQPYSKNWNLKIFQEHNFMILCDEWNAGLRDGDDVYKYTVDKIIRKSLWYDPTSEKSMKKKALSVFSEVGHG